MTAVDQKKLDEIYVAIVGNPAMGTRGLAERIRSLEDYKKKDQTLKNKIVGALAIGTPLLVALWNILVEWVKAKFN